MQQSQIKTREQRFLCENFVNLGNNAILQTTQNYRREVRAVRKGKERVIQYMASLENSGKSPVDARERERGGGGQHTFYQNPALGRTLEWIFRDAKIKARV